VYEPVSCLEQASAEPHGLGVLVLDGPSGPNRLTITARNDSPCDCSCSERPP
jgi:hypothetical protein